MSKKQKLITLVLVLFVLAAGVAAVYFLFIKSNDTTIQSSVSKQATIVSGLSSGGADTVPLESKPKNSNSGGLTVNDSANVSSNLGSGTVATGSNSASSSSTSSPDSFKEYEQYKTKNEVFFGDIAPGSGAVAQKDSQLAVTYKGYLTNGKIFDQSKQVGSGQLQPLLFKLGSGQLIPGFEQGVAGMKAGGTRRIIIPPSLGYGDQANNGIPANSVLVFDVQLLTVQ